MRTPKRPAHRKRQPKPKPTPAYRRANHGLTAIAQQHNVSYASLYRQHVTLGNSLLAAVDYCTEHRPALTRRSWNRRCLDGFFMAVCSV